MNRTGFLKLFHFYFWNQWEDNQGDQKVLSLIKKKQKTE